VDFAQKTALSAIKVSIVDFYVGGFLCRIFFRGLNTYYDFLVWVRPIVKIQQSQIKASEIIDA